MSRSTLRKVRRLKAAAAPVIAELERRKAAWEASKHLSAQNHLLRVIAVFFDGNARIDEPLKLAYDRALSQLGGTDSIALVKLRLRLEQEPPTGDIRSKISQRLREIPDWLHHLCWTLASTKTLGIDFHVPAGRYKPTGLRAWPFLPHGILIPDDLEVPRFLQEMSLEEVVRYRDLLLKPEVDWTRHERRFVQEMFDRE
jgi:hypothetical protein